MTIFLHGAIYCQLSKSLFFFFFLLLVTSSCRNHIFAFINFFSHLFKPSSSFTPCPSPNHNFAWLPVISIHFRSPTRHLRTIYRFYTVPRYLQADPHSKCTEIEGRTSIKTASSSFFLRQSLSTRIFSRNPIRSSTVFLLSIECPHLATSIETVEFSLPSSSLVFSSSRVLY